MTFNEDLKKLLDEHQEQVLAYVDELKKKDITPKTVWDLNYNDEFFVLNAGGTVDKYIYCSSMGDIQQRDQGNIFLTRQEAEDEARRRKIRTQLRRLANGHEFVSGETSWYIYYGFVSKCFHINYVSEAKHDGLVYFKSEAEARKAIETIGEDDMKFLFGVE